MSIRPLRPSYPAKECLLQWHPTNMRNPSHPLAPSDTQCVYSVIAHTWAESTKETYGSGLLVYHTFCDWKEIPEDQRAPASPALISAFISTNMLKFLPLTCKLNRPYTRLFCITSSLLFVGKVIGKSHPPPICWARHFALCIAIHSYSSGIAAHAPSRDWLPFRTGKCFALPPITPSFLPSL